MKIDEIASESQSWMHSIFYLDDVISPRIGWENKTSHMISFYNEIFRNDEIEYDRICPFENVILSKFIFENDKTITDKINSDFNKDYYIQTNPIRHFEDIKVYQFDDSKYASCVILFQDLNEDILNKISKYIRELLEMLNVETRVLNAINYVLSETHDNIIQHSGAENVWIQFKINRELGFF